MPTDLLFIIDNALFKGEISTNFYEPVDSIYSWILFEIIIFAVYLQKKALVFF